jgi:hypothetical protein
MGHKRGFKETPNTAGLAGNKKARFAAGFVVFH